MHRKDMTRGKEILHSLGYCPGQPERVWDEATYLRTHHDYVFIKKSKDNEIPLELQWGVTEASFFFPIEFQPLWDRRRTAFLIRKNHARSVRGRYAPHSLCAWSQAWLEQAYLGL